MQWNIFFPVAGLNMWKHVWKHKLIYHMHMAVCTLFMDCHCPFEILLKFNRPNKIVLNLVHSQLWFGIHMS